MTTRIVLGARANGDVGIFVSPPGVDADTAADASLSLNVTAKVSQLIAIGRVTTASVVPLALARSPFVFICSEYDFAAITGHTLGPGPLRPSPPNLTGPTPATAVINSNGVSMTVTLGSVSSGGPWPTRYHVYSKAFT